MHATARHIFPGVLRDCRLEGEIPRIATFVSSLVVIERIISVDAALMHVAHTVMSGAFEHHNASMQIVAQGADTAGLCGYVICCLMQRQNASARCYRPAPRPRSGHLKNARVGSCASAAACLVQ